MNSNLAVMTIGATFGVTYALERMGRSKGGVGGRIITTASTAGLTVSFSQMLLRMLSIIMYIIHSEICGLRT